jgi:hypothetical protein
MKEFVSWVIAILVIALIVIYFLAALTSHPH